jgi:hypothetical protein
MKLLQGAALVLVVLATTACASKPMAPVPMVPYGAPAGAMAEPWMTAAGCDRDLARRFGKSC